MPTATRDNALREFERLTHLTQVAERLGDTLVETRRRIHGAGELASILLESESMLASLSIEIDDEETERTHLVAALRRLDKFDAASIAAHLTEADEATGELQMRLDAAEAAARRSLRGDDV
jgi:hypothetical protein